MSVGHCTWPLLILGIRWATSIMKKGAADQADRGCALQLGACFRHEWVEASRRLRWGHPSPVSRSGRGCSPPPRPQCEVPRCGFQSASVYEISTLFGWAKHNNPHAVSTARRTRVGIRDGPRTSSSAKFESSTFRVVIVSVVFSIPVCIYLSK